MAAVEKSIIIRVLTSSSSGAKMADDSGVDGYDFQKLFPKLFSRRQRCPSCCSDPDIDPDPDPNPISQGSTFSESAWFILEPADSGLKLSRIFVGLQQDQFMLDVLKPASTLIGSSLYEIGGNYACHNNHITTGRRDCREIRSLDIENQSDGWKSCSYFNFQFHGDRAAAFNQFIYMFGPMTEDYVPAVYFAYVYDTIEQEGYLIQAPPELLRNPEFESIAEVWAPLEGHGMLVSFPRDDNGNFYLHYPDRDCWKFCEDYEKLPSSVSGPSSVLNDILYICDKRKHELHAYNCKEGKLLYSVKLPRLCTNTRIYDDEVDMSYHPERLVAVSDSTLCIIGHSLSYLFCARVLVSFDPAPSAKLLGVQCFRTDKISHIFSCVPVDASLGQIAKSFSPLKETREEHMLSKGELTVELSGNVRKMTGLSEDTSLLGQKSSKNSMNPNSTFPIFPVSKRMLCWPPTKKVKREQRVVAQRLSRLRLSPLPRNPPLVSTHQSSDNAVRIINIPSKIKLKRHQDMKGLGNDLSEGQG